MSGWRRLQLEPLSQNTEFLETSVYPHPSHVLSQGREVQSAPQKNTHVKFKKETRKKDGFSGTRWVSFLESFPCRSDSCSPVSDHWHRYSLAQLWLSLPAPSWIYVVVRLQKTTKRAFCMSCWTKGTPWAVLACPAALLWFLAAPRPVLIWEKRAG